MLWLTHTFIHSVREIPFVRHSPSWAAAVLHMTLAFIWPGNRGQEEIPGIAYSVSLILFCTSWSSISIKKTKKEQCYAHVVSSFLMLSVCLLSLTALIGLLAAWGSHGHGQSWLSSFAVVGQYHTGYHISTADTSSGIFRHGLQDRDVPLGQAHFHSRKPMFLFCPLLSRCWCVSTNPFPT